jgi:PIN domain nuclease of toxin-antitoxin system
VTNPPTESFAGGPILLDSSALLALCLDEPGAEVVAGAISSSPMVAMTAANIAEFTSRLLRKGWEPRAVEQFIASLEITVVREEMSLGLLAGELHGRTRHMGLSTGDALCLAAAAREGWPVLTADRAWATLDLGIPVVLIR